VSLQAKDLSVMRAARRVLDAVSLEAAPGELLAICGPNGAGKSTLLQALLGVLPASGSVCWNQRPLEDLPPRERARLLAYVPQRTRLIFDLRVDAVVAQGRYAHHGPLAGLGARDREICAEALAACDATALASRPFTRLSAGEQQRVLLARALATEAPVLLVDEPTSSLDVGHGLDILQRLRALAGEGRCVICVLHRLDEVLRFADRVLLLDRAALVASGAPSAVLDQARLHAVYVVSVRDQAAPAFDRWEGVR
jgi:iron complex transport system ATP-binding protein